MTTNKDVLARLITAEEPENIEEFTQQITDILKEKYGDDRGKRLLKIVIVQLIEHLE